MATMYKGKKQCTADLHQIPAMEAAGWSRTEPKAKPKTEKKVEAPKAEEKVEAPKAEAEKTETPAPKAEKKTTATPKKTPTRRRAKK